LGAEAAVRIEFIVDRVAGAVAWSRGACRTIILHTGAGCGVTDLLGGTGRLTRLWRLALIGGGVAGLTSGASAAWTGAGLALTGLGVARLVGGAGRFTRCLGLALIAAGVAGLTGWASAAWVGRVWHAGVGVVARLIVGAIHRVGTAARVRHTLVLQVAGLIVAAIILTLTARATAAIADTKAFVTCLACSRITLIVGATFRPRADALGIVLGFEAHEARVILAIFARRHDTFTLEIARRPQRAITLKIA
jgi:hypothetical protein